MIHNALIQHWPQLRERWQLLGEPAAAIAIGHGLINAGWRVATTLPEAAGELFLQRINTSVFTAPEVITRNSLVIAGHLNAKKTEGLYDYEILRPLATTIQTYHHQHEQDYWRAYQFIGNGHSKDALSNQDEAYSCALAFAHFVGALSDLDSRCISTTIADFHEPMARIRTLELSLSADACQRRRHVQAELSAITQHQVLLQRYQQLTQTQDPSVRMPLRIVHNDTKLSNVLFDNNNRVICVVDWDTVMPGFLIFDFGDMVRSLCNADEDASNRAEIFDLSTYASLCAGYLQGIGSVLQPIERAHMVLGAQLITLELAIRFLSDYLDGDRYFRVDHPEQNWRRAQNQLALLAAMRSAESAMLAALK